VGVGQAVLAGADPLQQALARQRVGEHDLDLGGDLLGGDDLDQPLARHQVLDHGGGDPGAGEVGRVVDPDRPWPVLDPVRERLAKVAARSEQRPQPQALARQHAAHAGRRHPHPRQVGAAVGELAVGAVDLAPLLGQPHDRGDLPVQQATHRGATRGLVGQLASGAPAQPPVDAQLADLQHLADGPHPPALLQGLLEQVQQPSLGGRVHPRRDLATQSQRPFPSTSTSLTASSLTASPSRPPLPWPPPAPDPAWRPAHRAWTPTAPVAPRPWRPCAAA
jgi:hypothetical protein